MVRIRMKKMGRAHRPFYRICAADARSPRDGRVLEELGTYDTSVPLTDARVTLNHERLQYWLGIGAQPSHKVSVLIRKYGPDGTHLEQQAAAREKLNMPKEVSPTPKPVAIEEPAPEPTEEASSEEAPTEEATAETESAGESESSES